MSRPAAPDPAKLVVGVFMADRGLLPEVVQRLCERHGPLDIVSPWLAFDQTDYYAPEMGPHLARRIMTFKPLIDPGCLASVKTATNALEAELARDGRRRINIDPGILTRERFVLATGKNYSHRIYLADGIYADLTLVYQDGGFQPLPWTYPDYAGDPIRSLLAVIREKYLRDLCSAPPGREEME